MALTNAICSEPAVGGIAIANRTVKPASNQKEKGPNVIRAAIVNGGGATDFCARLLDAEDGPLTALTIRLP